MIRSRQHRPGRRAQRGAVGVIVAAMIFVILGVCGMAIDLGFMYNRRVEMQNLADAAALAAAAELNGTTAGVTQALASANSVAGNFRYSYTHGITWSSAALQFGASPDRSGAWFDAAAAQSAPDGKLFVRVDTTRLSSAPGLVSTVFMNVLGAGRTVDMQGEAIAGRTGIKVMPLAVCALSGSRAEGRDTPAGKELIEWGFRRGVSYNLMDLNPHGGKAAHFTVNPFAPPGLAGTAGPTSSGIIGPYVCSGTMSMARVMGGTLTVAADFPLAAVFEKLNSRFKEYTGSACSAVLAPPDANVKAYTYKAVLNPDGTTTPAGVDWMSTAPLAQSAAMLDDVTRRITIADAAPTPAGSTAGMFGPLWSYARAVPFSNYVAGKPEPATGYAPFPATDWSKLYSPGEPVANGFPATGPYQATSGATFKAPASTVRAQVNRRVLNVPLLECPVAGTTATAKGIGKFFMTVPATKDAIFAEFAGIASEQALGTTTVLFP
ncbi:MAG TPA: pilus assembly protein TadG-related protein [Telluria sp.]